MSTGEDRVRETAAALDAGQAVTTTPRELLSWFGAMKRGAVVAQQIRSMLRAHGLKTAPDFESDAAIDQRIEFRRVDAEVKQQWQQCFEQAAALHASGARTALTVRELLRLFGYERRGQVVVQRVREALADFGLRTEPDFESAYIDAKLEFSRVAVDSPSDASGLPSEPANDPAHDQAVGASLELWSAGAAPASGTGEDAVLRVGMMRSANLEAVQLKLYKVAPTEPLANAITTMLLRDFSQLPVMSDERTVKGVISWKSIGQHLGLKDGWRERPVQDFMVPHNEVAHDVSLLAAIPNIAEREYVLVRGPHNTITGIVTTVDLALQFREQTEPFLLLGEIENQIRRLIGNRFTPAELQAASRAGESGRNVDGVHDLTFGEYIRLLQDSDHWQRLGLSIDRKQFMECLEEVRGVRNEVMHFDPGAQRPEQLETLRRASRFLRELQVTGAL